MDNAKITNLYDLEQTFAAEIFEGKTYPWEVLPLIKEVLKSREKVLGEKHPDTISALHELEVTKCKLRRQDEDMH